MMIMFVTSLAVFIKVNLFSVLIDSCPKWVNCTFFINIRILYQFVMTLNVNEIVKVLKRYCFTTSPSSQSAVEQSRGIPDK
jgi:hypothetical protein